MVTGHFGAFQNGSEDMDSVNVSELVARLGSEEESVRKMAVFKLQNAIGDPSFADVFIYEGGLPKLRYLALHSTGNTLAYCLTSLARLLELDKGWDHVTDDLIVRVSEGEAEAHVIAAV
jgi:engulfment/cell motility protein 1